MTPVTAISYSRRSSEQRDNYSLSYQDKANLACAERESLHVIESIAEDITGTIHLRDRKPSRAEIKRGDVQRHGCDVWELIEAHRVKAIIVYRLDRLSRADTVDALALIRDILRHGCRIYISSTSRQITDPNDIAVIIDSWQSGKEKDAIIEKLRDGRLGKAKEKWVGIGPVPYGYKKIGEGKAVRLVIDKATAKIVREIFSRYNGVPTMRGIAEDLNKRGVPSPKGNLWRFSTVRWILNSTVYIGRVHYGGVEMTDKSLAIVPLHEWQAAQERMKQNKSTAARNTKNQYIMRGHITCACGSKMTPVTNKGHQPRYICMKRVEPKARKCYESAAVEQIDRLAVDYIKWAVTDEVLAAGAAENAKRDAERSNATPDRLTVIAAELDKQHRRIDRLMLAFGDGDDAAMSAITSARESIAMLEAERETLSSAEQDRESHALARESIAAQVRRLRSRLDGASFELLRELATIIDVRARLVRDEVGRGVVISSAIAPDLFTRL